MIDTSTNTVVATVPIGGSPRGVAINQAGTSVYIAAITSSGSGIVSVIDTATNTTVFVTGSLIPQRIKLRPIGTTTVSPLRIIDRHEIDWTGRQTTAGAFVVDPSVRIIGH